MKWLKLALVCDLLEEGWPSMDLVGEMLIAQFGANHSDQVSAVKVRPPMNRRFTALPAVGQQWASNNADRMLNRYWDYPRWLRSKRDDFDLFHLMDHSYGHLLHELPSGTAVVTCHDLDTFRCLLEPEAEPRPLWFRSMMRRTLDGFRRAARVICVSESTRQQLLAERLFEPALLSVIPNGVHPSCTAEGNLHADAAVVRLLGAPNSNPLLLNVGSTIPRKRIETLLSVFSEVKRIIPCARLIRVGGGFTPEQNALLQDLNLEGAVTVLPFLDREDLAAVYRRATLLLQPSEREGFGLPLAESMACGTNCVASDIPAMHEVGGDAVTYCPVDDVTAWSETVISLLTERDLFPAAWRLRCQRAITRAANFTWAENARKVVSVYQELLPARSSHNLQMNGNQP